MTPFDTYTFEKAQARIPVDRDSPALDVTAEGMALASGYAANRRLYAGDHWGANGEGWVGPRPGAGEADAASVLLEIRRAFISKNAVKEVTDRHTGGVIGHEPQWKLTVRRALGKVEVEEEVDMGDEWGVDEETGMTKPLARRPPRTVKKLVDEEPNEIEQALIKEAEAALTAWWDERGAHGVLQDATVAMLLARRGILRLFVPPGLLQDGRVPLADLPTSLRRIYLHAPDPTQATVTTDANTQQQAGIYVYEEEAEGKRATERAELVYLDEAGRTVLRILGGEEDAAAAPLDLSGHLTIYEMERDALITPQVRQLQALLNMALSMLARNSVLGGFLERILLNVQLPGRYEGEGEERRFVPDTFRVGAGTTNALMGATYTDEQGMTRMASPSVVYRDPVPVVTFVDTKREAYTGILEETDQMHALISGDATASGESRKQARADFEASLRDTQAELHQAGRWLLETVLSMGAAFSGQAGRFAELRAVFECRIDSGPISAADQREVRENVKAGLRSEETGMAETGVQDVDAEKERIAAERDARMARSAKMVQQQPVEAAAMNGTANTNNGSANAQGIPS